MNLTQPTQCPYCPSIVQVNIKWAQQNGRVFCGGCCKSFEIHVGEEEKEQVVNREEVIEELEKELDKAVEEFEPKENDWSWF